MSRHVGSFRFATSAVAGFALATSALTLYPDDAAAQRGGRGTMSVPRVTTAQPAPPRGASPGVPSRPSMPSARGGYITTPGAASVVPNHARRGDLPRIVTAPPPRLGGYGRGYGTAGNRASRYWRAPYTRWGVGAGCTYGCGGGIRANARVGRFAGTFVVGYPLFAVPVIFPFYYDAGYERYTEVVTETYVPEPPRSASKVIVIGTGSAGGSDALTVESLGDSVRLRWLANGRPAREVKLFVADSAKRELATRSASPSAPTATFEVATLSAPVAFAGVTVVFADGVTSTTLVPYRGDAARQPPR